MWERIITKNRDDGRFVTVVSITVLAPPYYFRLIWGDSNRRRLDRALMSNDEHIPR